MKIGILSDLHLPAYGTLPQPAQACDVMILAGDIAEGLSGIAWAETVYACPIIYVIGNHEYYGQDMDELDSRMQ